MRLTRSGGATLLLGLLLISSLAACGSSAGASIGGGAGTTGGGLTPVGAGVAGAPEPAASAGGGQGVQQPGSVDGSSGGRQTDGVGAPVDDARIVRTGTIALQVKDVPTALTTARAGMRAIGAYIGASQTQDDGGSPIASVTYRVPADRWEDALDLLATLGGQTTKVVSTRTDAVEVTSQLVDLDARIRNLRASETSLQAIVEKAVKVSDVLEVEAQLTQIRGQIEQLAAQQKDLGDRAAYGTLTATFGVPVVAVEAARSDWDPATVVDDASASLVTVLQGLTTAGIWFAIVWLPLLLLVGVVVAIVAFVLRRTGRGRAIPPGPAAPMGPSGPTPDAPAV